MQKNYSSGSAHLPSLFKTAAIKCVQQHLHFMPTSYLSSLFRSSSLEYWIHTLKHFGSMNRFNRSVTCKAVLALMEELLKQNPHIILEVSMGTASCYSKAKFNNIICLLKTLLQNHYHHNITCYMCIHAHIWRHTKHQEPQCPRRNSGVKQSRSVPTLSTVSQYLTEQQMVREVAAEYYKGGSYYYFCIYKDQLEEFQSLHWKF